MWQNCTVEIQANVQGEGVVPAGITPTLDDAHVFARSPTAQTPGMPVQVVLYDPTGAFSVPIVAQAVQNVSAANGQMAGVLMRLNINDPELEISLLRLIGHKAAANAPSVPAVPNVPPPPQSGSTAQPTPPAPTPPTPTQTTPTQPTQPIAPQAPIDASKVDPTTGLAYGQDPRAPAPNTSALPDALKAVLRQPGHEGAAQAAAQAQAQAQAQAPVQPQAPAQPEAPPATVQSASAQPQVPESPAQSQEPIPATPAASTAPDVEIPAEPVTEDMGPELELDAEMVEAGATRMRPPEPKDASDWRESLRVYESGGRFKDAVELLRKVLDSNPMDMDTHLKLADLALKIDNVKLAQWHAEFVKKMEPSNQSVDIVLTSIRTKRTEIAERRKKNKISQKVVRAVRSPAGRGKVLLGILSFAIIVATGVWNYFRIFRPDVAPVTVVKVTEITDILPAKEVKLFEQRLYITVGSQWFALGPDKQEQALERLRDRAKSKYDVKQVTLMEPGPKVVATINGKKLQLLR